MLSASIRARSCWSFLAASKSEPSKLINLLNNIALVFPPYLQFSWSCILRTGRSCVAGCGMGKRLHEMQIDVMMGGHDCMTDQWPVAHIPMASSCGGSSLPLFPLQ